MGAVKALLFNVDGQTPQSSTRESSASGRTSRERATTTNVDSKENEKKGKRVRSSKTTTRNERPKETREQCNAVKALLFNVDGQTAQSSTRETSASGRTSRERATTTTTTTNSK